MNVFPSPIFVATAATERAVVPNATQCNFDYFHLSSFFSSLILNSLLLFLYKLFKKNIALASQHFDDIYPRRNMRDIYKAFLQIAFHQHLIAENPIDRNLLHPIMLVD